MQEDAGLNGIQLAERLGWDDTKVSKITNGRQARVTRPEVAAWARATGYTGNLTDLFELLEDEQTKHRRYVSEMRRRGGAAPVQADLDAQGRAATRIRDFAVLIVTGMLQTEQYARCIAQQAASISGTSDIDETVAARLKRQEILRKPDGRTFEFILTEATLRTWVCPRAVMAGQLYHLIAVSQLPHVTLGIIPMGVELELAPFSTFMMFDDQAVEEEFTGDKTLGEGESRLLDQIFARLMAESVTGDAARALIVDAAAALR